MTHFLCPSAHFQAKSKKKELRMFVRASQKRGKGKDARTRVRFCLLSKERGAPQVSLRSRAPAKVADPKPRQCIMH